MKKEFIFTHNPTSDDVVEEIRQKLPSFIDGKRLNHTFFVEKEAITIAKAFFLVYNISDKYLNDIRAAALLHDLTKQMDLEKQLEMCEKYGIDKGVNPSGAILHGKTAAFLAKDLFGINDTVFSAIFCHTTGKENMSIFDKIIFLADYTEESRTAKSCVNTRAFLHSSMDGDCKKIAYIIDRAIVMSIDGTLSHLIETGKDIDIQTVLARNSILTQTAFCN